MVNIVADRPYIIAKERNVGARRSGWMIGIGGGILSETALAALLLAALVAPALRAGEAEASWEPALGTLFGGEGGDEVGACAAGPGGTLWVGTSAAPPAQALEVFDLAGGSSGGTLLRIDGPTGLLLSATRLPGAPQRIRVAPDGNLFVAAGGTILALDATGTVLRWRGGPGGRFDLDGAGGVWVAQKDRVVRVGEGGKELAAFAAGTGWGNEDIAVDAKNGLVFTCGSRSDKGVSNPVHVPWLHAYGVDGRRRWTAWDFPGKECDRVGDMADSHPRRLWFAAGRLWLAGDTEGGNTPYRHDPLKAGGPVGKAFEGSAYTETWRAFTSCRMLFVGGFDPATGALQRGSFCYGFVTRNGRLEVGDADVGDLCADEQGRVYLTGVMRCAPRRTGNAVHRAAAPADRKGRWGNSVATDELFLVVFGKDLVGQEFCSGFNQGGSGTVASRGLAVGAADGWAVVGGQVKGPSAGPAASSTWLRAPWQSAYAGSADAYLAVLGPESASIARDPVARAQAALRRLFPQQAALAQRRDLGALLTEQAAAGEEGKRIAAVLQRIAEAELARAADAIPEEYAGVVTGLKAVAAAWAPTPVAATAGARAVELAAHPEYAASIEIQRLADAFARAEATLRPARGAQEETWADRAWQVRNNGTLRRMQSLTRDLVKRFPQARATATASGACSALLIPLGDDQEKQAARLARYWAAAQRLSLPAKMETHDARNGDWRKMNGPQVAEMEAALAEMEKADAGSPYTAAAREHAKGIRLK